MKIKQNHENCHHNRRIMGFPPCDTQTCVLPASSLNIIARLTIPRLTIEYRCSNVDKDPKECSAVPSYEVDTRGSGYFCVGFCSSQSNAFFTGHFPPCLNLHQSGGKEWGMDGWRKGELVKIQRAGELVCPGAAHTK